MKKLLGLLLTAFAIFAVIACEELTTTATTAATTASTTATTASPTSTSTTTGTTTETTTEPTTQMTTTTEEVPAYTVKTVEFINFSTEFIDDTPMTALDLYFYPEKAGIPYVDISEFIELLRGIIDETIQVEIDPVNLTVNVFVEYFLTEEEKIEYGTEEDSIVEYCLFNFASTTVSAPNIDSFDYFTGETETDFSAGLNLVSYTEEELPAFHVDLTPYLFTFKILSIDGDTDRFTIPLHLADLFLTGSMFDVVNNGDYLYGIDTYQLGDVDDETSPLHAAAALNDDETPAMKTESENYLAFVFDYFYGLKDYKSIDSFIDYVDTYFSRLTAFEKSLYKFTDSLADLHTGIISVGHTNPTYDYYATTDYPDYIYDYSYEYYGCGCNTVTEPFLLEFYEDLAYYRIDGFTSDFKTDIEADMEAIRAADPEYVIIDLSCNGGGVLAGVFHLLNYLTNADISFYTVTLGARSSATYDVEGDLAIDAEFFIITSAATYSAANLFTALAVENNLARTIGSQSGGGACSVKAIVLPNGAIMQMSSNMNLAYSTYETVEEGVAPNYSIDWGRNYTDRIPYPTLAEFLAIIEGMPPAA
ncbi:MAG: S41 family peptidase [bacterium]